MSQQRHGLGEARIGLPVQRQLGMRLRALYRGFVGEPVPDAHIELLLALRRVERDRRRGGDRNGDASDGPGGVTS